MTEEKVADFTKDDIEVLNTYVHDDFSISIGRGASCNITLDDPRVSTEHAVLMKSGSEYNIIDMESSNGIFVNGEKIKVSQTVKAGDVIKIGESSLKASYSGASIKLEHFKGEIKKAEVTPLPVNETEKLTTLDPILNPEAFDFDENRPELKDSEKKKLETKKKKEEELKKKEEEARKKEEAQKKEDVKSDNSSKVALDPILNPEAFDFDSARPEKKKKYAEDPNAKKDEAKTEAKKSDPKPETKRYAEDPDAKKADVKKSDSSDSKTKDSKKSVTAGKAPVKTTGKKKIKKASKTLSALALVKTRAVSKLREMTLVSTLMNLIFILFMINYITQKQVEVKKDIEATIVDEEPGEEFKEDVKEIQEEMEEVVKEVDTEAIAKVDAPELENSEDAEDVNEADDAAEDIDFNLNDAGSFKVPVKGIMGGGSSEFMKRVVNNGGQYQAVDIRVSMIWNTTNDLDLRVEAPGGDEIYYGNNGRDSRTKSRGVLDIDKNASEPLTRRPVENVRWKLKSAPSGTYIVKVNNFQFNTKSKKPYKFYIELYIHGKTFKYSGLAGKNGVTGESMKVVEFKYNALKKSFKIVDAIENPYGVEIKKVVPTEKELEELMNEGAEELIVE